MLIGKCAHIWWSYLRNRVCSIVAVILNHTYPFSYSGAKDYTSNGVAKIMRRASRWSVLTVSGINGWGPQAFPNVCLLAFTPSSGFSPLSGSYLLPGSSPSSVILSVIKIYIQPTCSNHVAGFCFRAQKLSFAYPSPPPPPTHIDTCLIILIIFSLYSQLSY